MRVWPGGPSRWMYGYHSKRDGKTMSTIDYSDLRDFVFSILRKAGLDDYSVEAVGEGLCETSLRGVDSHGVRLLPHYVNSALGGRKNPRPVFDFRQTFPVMGCLDADNAFGHAAGMKAMEHCIRMAGEYGMGCVGVGNSSHPGAMASFALKAARQGFIGFAFTHADSLLLSHGGVRPYFGTNPVCVAAPRQGEEPFCLDMATSVIPWNRLLLHQSRSEPLADNVAADKDGLMTNDPAEAVCLMPTGAYKGNGLASMVEMLCAVFTGMAFGRDIPAMYKAPIGEPRRLGQFYMAMRTDGCVDAETFAASMREMSEAVRSEPAREGEEVMIAGDKEIRTARIRREQGIELDPETLRAFGKLSETHGVPLVLR